MKKKRITTYLLLLIFGNACIELASASNPSFDCGKAKKPAEKLICRDSALSELDFKLGNLFQALLDLIGHRDASVIAVQRKWLA